MKQWMGGVEQRPVTLSRWAENSVGDRFFSQKWVSDAARAPALADVELPDPDVFTGDPGHRVAAMSVLFRGVVLDGVQVGDRVIQPILDMLTPVVLEELARIDEAEEEWGFFEETNGPLFLLGHDTLAESAWVILGDDPVAPVLAVLEWRIQDALAAAGFLEATSAKVIAETLVRALADDYEFEEPGDTEALERLGRDSSGNVLLDLIDAEQVAPEDTLRLGLVILAALADMARTDAESILS
jgi:hypothetical protein